MPCVYDNKFVIIEQEKIALQKDSLEAGLDLLKLCFDSALTNQKSKKRHNNIKVQSKRLKHKNA
jgi:hypothetical protein